MSRFIVKVRFSFLAVLLVVNVAGCTGFKLTLEPGRDRSSVSLPDVPPAPLVTKNFYPKESDEVLNNPGMGFVNFMDSFGGQVPAPPEYPNTSTAYFRWHWHELEPSPGAYNFDLVASTIARARSRGQQLTWRIMPEAPQWLIDQGVGYVGTPAEGLADHNHPLFLSNHEKLIRAFADRFASSPDINFMDIGSVGCWGEWNAACCPASLEATCQAYLPTRANQTRIADWYFEYFPNTKLIALSNEITSYKVAKGSGWRGDCFGDYGFFGNNWNHMEMEYPSILNQPGVSDAWKNAPVEFEACYVMSSWLERGFDIDKILQRALDWHMSSFNGKNSAVPPEWRDKVNQWLKKIGYRFVIRRISHVADISRGSSLQILSEWQNKGVAPIYKNWPIAYRLRSLDSNDESPVHISTVNLKQWLPGDHQAVEVIRIPSNLPPGSYSLDVTILDENKSKPHVKIAIQDRRADGWHPISTVKIN